MPNPMVGKKNDKFTKQHIHLALRLVHVACAQASPPVPLRTS